MNTFPAAELYDWLLFLHIVAAMIWVGGLVALTVLATQVLRSGERDAIARFIGSLRVIGPTALAPATVTVLGIGIWLVVDSDAWDFGQTWIVAALTLAASALVAGIALGGRAGISAQRAVAAGDDGEAAHQLRRWSWGMRLMLLLLIAATWDMVIKPGL